MKTTSTIWTIASLSCAIALAAPPSLTTEGVHRVVNRLKVGPKPSA